MTALSKDPPKPLDEGLYELQEDEYEFLSSQTGIKEQEQLKEHVLAVQAEVYKVCRLHEVDKLLNRIRVL